MCPVSGAAFPAGALGAVGASGFLVVLGVHVQISVGLQLQILFRQPVWVEFLPCFCGRQDTRVTF